MRALLPFISMGILAVANAPGQTPGGSAVDAADCRLVLPAEAWAGEVFPVDYRLTVPKRLFESLASDVAWDAGAATADAWGRPEQGQETVGGEILVTIAAHTRAFVASPGEYVSSPIRQEVTFNTGSSRFGTFVRPNLEEFTVASRPASIRIRALPPLPAGAGLYTGAVGKFAVASRVSPTSVKVGQSVTWTLELSGTGNWPEIKGLPRRQVPAAFHVLATPPHLQPRGSSRFEATLTEDLVLVADRAGSAKLGPLILSTFDVARGAYVRVSIPAVAIAVAAEPSRTASADSSAAWQWAGAGAAGAADQAVSPPVLPEHLLRDPLRGGGTAWRPMESRTVARSALLPLGAVLLFWIGLAIARAHASDPNRTRRAARSRAVALIAELGAPPSGNATQSRESRESPESRQSREAVRSTLSKWQREVVVLWGLPMAVPLPAVFGENEAWVRLWREADDVLHSEHGTLPEDWAGRARSAIGGFRVPRAFTLRLFAPGNFLPVALLVCLLTPSRVPAGPAMPALSTDAEALYRAGNFSGAEAAWRLAVERNPTEWTARHNLGLALAQQDRWPEAACELAAAFVQNPTNANVRWDFAVAWKQSHLGTGELAEFVEVRPAAWWARLAPPVAWQWTLIGSALMGATGLALVLWARFVPTGRALISPGFRLIVAGLVCATAGGVALSAYGTLAHADVGLVWRDTSLRSVPTEVGGKQKIATLPAGMLVRIDDPFLTWRHLVLSNGQTGWVRRDDFILLWQ